ncbi:aldehyde dehydrogenase family protein [Intrasporangium sp.]|uniref:aldehyde dehydrogenase family protein n=1 Tax=Intrasporangium sp. TaxID=1925024 RepID=UPI00293AF358|nr:aldehyde dehydrogenase family protein [Intrasporangium sp.]MDV3220453.1 aldehyde dehydrogenase family protein [Intrasporangium sp.]
MTEPNSIRTSGELFFEAHRALLESAAEASATRAAWSGFEAIPVPSFTEAESLVARHAGTVLDLSTPTDRVIRANEVSPYLLKPLDVTYAAPTSAAALAAASTAAPAMARATPRERVGVCLESLHRIHERGPELAAVTMHTTGQSLNMAASGSGTNALDRGLEAVAAAWMAMSRVPNDVTWTQTFGRSTVTLRKRFRTRPVGTALVIACASFPAWNAYPAILANLATGNPVLVKPHPSSVLGTALAVQSIRQVLREAGLPADAVQLVVDAPEELVAGEIATDPGVRIVDFTGSQTFGGWLERNLPGKLVYTETSGLNTVIIDSLHDVRSSMKSLATALSLFSGQMCTSPQNIYVPDRVSTDEGDISRAEVTEVLIAELDAIARHPGRAASICGAVQSAATVDAVRLRGDAASGRVLRHASPYVHSHHPGARTLTPLVIQGEPGSPDHCECEDFGPVAYVVPCTDTDEAVRSATGSVRRNGAISSYLFCTDETRIDEIADAYAEVGASLSVNLVSSMPMQYAAAYSDYHVTGLNPAGTATLTDEAFVAGRFRIVQDRRQVGS